MIDVPIPGIPAILVYTCVARNLGLCAWGPFGKGAAMFLNAHQISQGIILRIEIPLKWEKRDQGLARTTGKNQPAS